MFTIRYNQKVVRDDIPNLDKSVGVKIRAAIENKLVVAPDMYGSPLRANLKKYWKLRVGDWRIIYQINKNIVLVVRITHRSEVYR